MEFTRYFIEQEKLLYEIKEDGRVLWTNSSILFVLCNFSFIRSDRKIIRKSVEDSHLAASQIRELTEMVHISTRTV